MLKIISEKSEEKMKLKIEYKWKSIDGISKGKLFKITELTSDSVVYKSEDSCTSYNPKRRHFEKYIERVNKYWSETNKSYKRKKEKLKNEG